MVVGSESSECCASTLRVLIALVMQFPRGLYIDMVRPTFTSAGKPATYWVPLGSTIWMVGSKA
ncbi:hypothetical protein D9M70_557660 [compost metagenome]